MSGPRTWTLEMPAGMRLLSLRCVSVHDGRQIGIVFAFIRGVLLALILPPLLMDSAQRGLHDRLTGSIVVPAAEAPGDSEGSRS